jgi:hypothetical protein
LTIFRLFNKNSTKIQQVLSVLPKRVAEVLKIGRSGGHEPMNFQQSREKSSGEKFSPAARLAAGKARPAAKPPLIRLRRIAKRAFCHGMVKNQQGWGIGSVMNRSEWGNSTSEFPTVCIKFA